jgi:DNA-binding CsgD family transcriptional regulator
MFYIIPIMLKQLDGLAARLGLKHSAGGRFFALDANLRTVLMDLARQEKRPAQEVETDLLTVALAQRQTHRELYRRWQVLSTREQEVAALACLGYTNRQMAARLGVSEETIKTHIRNTLVKFNLHGKGELRMALEKWDFSEWER